MKKTITIWDVFAILLALLPLVYLFFVYDKLPAIVPTHYGADGKPNNFGPKSEMYTIGGILSGMSILLYLLMKYLPAIDPKRQVKYGERTYQKLGMGITVFFAAMNICIILAAANKGFSIDKLIIALSGLLFVFLGNIMYNIKPNYFAGVRTPWTLEDEGTWRATHRLTGKLWVAGGIIVTLERLLIPSKTGAHIFLGCIIIMVLIPVIYSYIYFKNHQPKKDI
ncbi:MAG: SdpI family protein [Mucilaginibacter sp.]